MSPAQLDAAAIGSSFQQKWSELQKLLERQRSKGGIIDPEEESNRFLIHINEVRGRLRPQRSVAVSDHVRSGDQMMSIHGESVPLITFIYSESVGNVFHHLNELFVLKEELFYFF